MGPRGDQDGGAGSGRLSAAETQRIAPNAGKNWWMWRPVVADPPLVSADGLGRLRLTQIADLHEILDLREEAARKVRAERDREARTRRFRRP